MENREPNSIKWGRWYRLKSDITRQKLAGEGLGLFHDNSQAVLRASVFMVKPHPSNDEYVVILKSKPEQPPWRLPESFIEPLTPGTGPNQQKTQTNP